MSSVCLETSNMPSRPLNWKRPGASYPGYLGHSLQDLQQEGTALNWCIDWAARGKLNFPRFINNHVYQFFDRLQISCLAPIMRKIEGQMMPQGQLGLLPAQRQQEMAFVLNSRQQSIHRCYEHGMELYVHHNVECKQLCFCTICTLLRRSDGIWSCAYDYWYTLGHLQTTEQDVQNTGPCRDLRRVLSSALHAIQTRLRTS